jgi:[ribosomal protein S5]-alanine N-acetyltransferase
MSNLPKLEMKDVYYPVIETERLWLRMFEPDDLDTAFLLFNDTDVQKYLSPKNKRTREQLETIFEKSRKYWKERGFAIWCVARKDDGKMIGYCGFQYFDKTADVEIVFAFMKQQWGKGFAAESAAASLQYGFEKLLLDKIFAVTDPQNTASRHVLEKLGMNYREKHPHYEMNTVTYSISQETFYSNKPKICSSRIRNLCVI